MQAIQLPYFNNDHKYLQLFNMDWTEQQQCTFVSLPHTFMYECGLLYNTNAHEHTHTHTHGNDDLFEIPISFEPL